MEISKYKVCSSNDGGQSTMTYINNSNSLIPTMNEEENSTHNTMSISLQKYFVNVQLKTLVQEGFKAAEFFLQRVVLQ